MLQHLLFVQAIMFSMLFTYFGLAHWLTFVSSILFVVVSVSDGFELKVHNNGPGILDASITFFAEVTGEGLLDSYIFEFEDNVFKSHDLVVKENRKANFTVLYNSEDNVAGTYEMTVKLYRSFIVFHELIATEITRFNLTDYINGNLTVSGGTQMYIPVKKPVNVTFNLEDQMGFFKYAKMNYAWMVNGVPILGYEDVLTFNASKEGPVAISLILSVMVPKKNTTLMKWGFFNTHLEALSPISNIQAIGSVFLQQGDVLSIQVVCNGSATYHYCWKVFPPNKTLPNMSCEDPVVTTRCSFPIMHFFPDAGLFHIGVVIGNLINNVSKIVDIHVNDVSKRAQLSTIIIPIVCSLLGIVIIVSGIAFHIHQRKRYSVEVADFDFQQPSVLLVEKTFFERLKDSLQVALANNYNTETEVKQPPSDGKSGSRDTMYGSTSPLWDI